MSTKAIILLGGPSKGTRFRPLSLHTPKPLFPICNEPLIHHHVRACKEQLGASLIELLMIGFFPPAELEPFLTTAAEEFGISIRYLKEDRELGTGGGLHKFRNEIKKGLPDDGTVLVIHGDVLCTFPLANLLSFHRSHGKTASILGQRRSADETQNYGCIVHDEETNEVLHYAEKPETFVSDVVNCGIYAFSPGLFDVLADAALKAPAKKTAMNVSGDMGPDARVRLEQDVFAQTLAGSGTFFCMVTEAWWTQLKHAGAPIAASELLMNELCERDPSAMTKAGTEGAATIVGNVVIHPSANVHPSAKIGPNVTIGANVVVGEGVRLKHAILLDGVSVEAHTCVLFSIIGWGSVVGKWSRVEGVPNCSDSLNTGGITIFGEGVTLRKERIIRNCIVLPNKELGASHSGEIIL
eukprot:TRINITY_DN7701_c0_g1_i1.p1 TRINITY_DN7701_c0_g1~~TRINITY_DN7701_c0_g1_i1.p1  ORF type:complete len:435 (+),score=124.59 TRINITY_DN7701_c0_g1_i1:74-1306(+)